MSKINEEKILERLEEWRNVARIELANLWKVEDEQAYKRIVELIKIFFAKEISAGPIKKDISRPDLIEWLQGINQAATAVKDYYVMKATTQLIEMIQKKPEIRIRPRFSKRIEVTEEFIEEKAKQLYTEVGIQYREILDKINVEDFIRQLLEEARGMGEDWLPTPENINALPEPVRDYIAAMQTNADPPSMVADNIIMKDTIKTLEKMLEELPEITEEWAGKRALKILSLIKQAQDEDLEDPAMSLHFLGLSLDIVNSIISDLRPGKGK